MDSHSHLQINTQHNPSQAENLPHEGIVTRKILEELSFGLDRKFVDLDLVMERSKLSSAYQISSYEINNHIAETAAYMTVSHPDYSLLAGRISIWSLHQQTKESFSAVTKDMYEYKDITGKYQSLNSLKFKGEMLV